MAERTIPSRTGGWGVPVALVALCVPPLVAGALRLVTLAGVAELMPGSARFAAAPLPVLLHIAGAAAFAILGALQFAPGFRRRRPGWHRAAGRLVVACGLLVGLSGLWMSLFYARPHNVGDLLTGFRLFFGSAMLASIVLGFVTIRRGDVRRHRAWMARAYAIGLGAGTQMFTGLVASAIVSPPTELSRALQDGSGWAINLAVAEWVVRRRPTPPLRAVSAASAPHARRRRYAAALALGAAVALFGVSARPNPPSLSTAVTGDAALAARARPLLPGALDRVSVAVVEGHTVTYAGFDADEHTEYEIGSITKTLTGQLLADAIRRGEVTADTRAGALLPLGVAPVADVTLAELASHRSGLSAQGMRPGDAIPWVLRLLRHRDPFTQDVDGVLAIARKTTLTHRGGFVYSNLGAALLGHALAAAAHMDYARLVQERLFTPLGMAASSLPLTAERLPGGAPTGYSAAGVAEAPWTINGWAPAGGVRSTTADLVRYARALLDGSAPGADALTPRWEFGTQRIGYVWTTQDDRGHTVTAKNGLTGGFTSKIVLDRANRRAVIVLSNTAAQVDVAANSLLVGEHAWTSSQ